MQAFTIDNLLNSKSSTAWNIAADLCLQSGRPHFAQELASRGIEWFLEHVKADAPLAPSDCKVRQAVDGLHLKISSVK